ncbi:hypothetical protein E4O00_02680 [Treponema sp. OMZ 788]|uniref:hypothetical protein n=1 Tax=Treponema sp. OMZ 788 TaxID=2563664 RepID=UPI0020A4CB00|nr:hypothetical protein [Treponema sp. OMZ 788]UTC65098.1 hypothetical protein E4O00_02680 [Treponema sp. OMZ 788]
MKYIRTIMLMLIACLVLTSCAPKADVFVQPSGDVVVTLDIQTGKTIDALLENAAQFTAEEKAKSPSIFNTEEIKKELEAKGIKVLNMTTNSIAGINAKIKIMSKDMDGETSFVKTDMKAGLLSLSIGPDNIKEFVSLLSEDDREYIELLMAPAITGEPIETAEYEDLIKAAYGDKLASDLKRSKFHVSITCPKKIKSIKITPFGYSSKDGNKGTVDIPLSELLCVRDPIFVEVKF